MENNSRTCVELDNSLKDVKESLESEKSKVQELQNRLKERDSLIEELNMEVEKSKHHSEIIEKQIGHYSEI